ncbi:hypothetical protein Scep_022468 [Stephania cephalantha]|uniref:Uncharacterized protein n=1 Tax=Stephania cephalantha TaxID=152367 RepID=A0AAP0FHN2_9MAGN
MDALVSQRIKWRWPWRKRDVRSKPHQVVARNPLDTDLLNSKVRSEGNGACLIRLVLKRVENERTSDRVAWVPSWIFLLERGAEGSYGPLLKGVKVVREPRPQVHAGMYQEEEKYTFVENVKEPLLLEHGHNNRIISSKMELEDSTKFIVTLN